MISGSPAACATPISAVQSFTRAGGYNSNYLVAAFFGLQNFPLTVTPVAPATGLRIEDDRLSWKASASWRPSPDLTTYATVSTGFRPPIVNAFAGRVSTIDPNDIVIPPGAVSDQLTNYEVGPQGELAGQPPHHQYRNLLHRLAGHPGPGEPRLGLGPVRDQYRRGGKLRHRVRDTGAAVRRPQRRAQRIVQRRQGQRADAEEAAISGAELGTRLASPHFQGSATVRYDFALELVGECLAGGERLSRRLLPEPVPERARQAEPGQSDLRLHRRLDQREPLCRHHLRRPERHRLCGESVRRVLDHLRPPRSLPRQSLRQDAAAARWASAPIMRSEAA